MTHGRMATILDGLRARLESVIGSDATWFVQPRKVYVGALAPSPESLDRPCLIVRCTGWSDFRTETDRELEIGRAVVSYEVLVIADGAGDSEEAMVQLLDMAEDVQRAVTENFQITDADGNPLVSFGATATTFEVDLDATAVFAIAAGTVGVTAEVDFPAR